MKLDDLLTIFVIYEAGFSEETLLSGKYIGEDKEKIYIAPKILAIDKKFIRQIKNVDEELWMDRPVKRGTSFTKKIERQRRK